MSKDTKTNCAARGALKIGLNSLSQRSGVPAIAGTEAFADVMMELLRLTLDRNETINLTTITEPEEFIRLQIIDSLAPVGLPELERAEKVVDVGSGAGFPGLPLAALYPEKRFLLTDSLRKRIEFAGFAAAALGLRNVDTLHSRAEKAGRDPAFREYFDLALCRAVGKLPLVLEYCLPLVKLGGAVIFYKTESARTEIEESILARRLLGGSKEVKIETYEDILPERKHALFIVTKEHPTPEAWPRREGIPSKTPL